MRKLGLAVVTCVVVALLASVLVHSASPDNVAWSWTTIEGANDAGIEVNIAISPVNGQPYISYFDNDDDVLRAATYVAHGGNCGNGEWQCATVDGGGLFTNIVGRYNDIAVSPTTGHPAIAYFDSTRRRLKFATTTCEDLSCSWTVSVIENTPLSDYARTGLAPSMKIGSDGVPQIAYQESVGLIGDSRLMHAKYVGSGGNCDNTAWQCTLIEEGAGYGGTPSLDLTSYLTPLNVPYIASYDSAQGALRYAWYLGTGTGNCGGGNWKCMMMDDSSDVGQNAALSLSNGGDFAAISYLDKDNGRLKIARTTSTVFPGNCGGGLWQCDHVYNIGVTSNAVGVAMQRQVGADPVAIFGCPGCYGHGIIRATWVGLGGNCIASEWDCEFIASDPFTTHDYSQYVDFALSGEGMVTLAFYDATAGDVVVGMERYSVYLPVSLME